MASNAVLSAQQSQVSTSMTLDREGSENWTGLITNVVLLPRLGQAQLIRVSVAFSNLVLPASISATIDVLLSDRAFEEYDLFGARKDKLDKEKDKRAKQGEF